MAGVSIGQAARQAGVSIDTVRYYERIGLIGAVSRRPGGYRQYAATDIARLAFVRRAKRLGFALEEIAELLQLEAGGGDRTSVRHLAERRLHDLEGRIAELSAMRDALATLVRRCSGRGSLAGCPIMAAIVDLPDSQP